MISLILMIDIELNSGEKTEQIRILNVVTSFGRGGLENMLMNFYFHRVSDISEDTSGNIDLS